MMDVSLHWQSAIAVIVVHLFNLSINSLSLSSVSQLSLNLLI